MEESDQDCGGRCMKEQYFVIDSEHLDEVRSHLYGFVITSDGRILTDDTKGHTDRTGFYTSVDVKDGMITIRQDFNGSFGLFLYRDDDYFAVSNSLYRLAEHLDGRLHIDPAVLKALLCSVYVPVSYHDTLIKEIRKTGSQDEVIIDIQHRELKITENTFPYFSRRPDTEEGLAALDHWYRKWVGILRGLVQQGYPVYADLSGGLDTRIILSMLLNSGIDLNTICIQSHSKVNLRKDAEDYRIASEIADHFGFPLNRDPNETVYDGRLDFREVYQAALDHSAGNTIMTKYIKSCSTFPVVCLKGFCSSIKGNTYMNSMLEVLRQYLERYRIWYPERTVSAGQMDERQFRVYVSDRIKEMADTDYRDERNVSLVFHKLICEKLDVYKALDHLRGGQYIITPFSDPEVVCMDYNTVHRADNCYLAYLILDRWCPELLDFDIQGREKKPSTLEMVRTINREHPAAEYRPAECISAKPHTIHRKTMSESELRSGLEEIWKSDAFSDAVRRYIDSDLMNRIIRAADRGRLKSRQKEINALLALYEMSRFCTENGGSES